MADFPSSAFQDADAKAAIGIKRPSPTNRTAAQNLGDYNLTALAAAQGMYPTALQIPTNPQFNPAGNSPSAPSPMSGLPNSPYNYSPLAAMNMMGMMHLANYGFNSAALGHAQPNLPALNIPAAQAYSPIAGLATANAGNGRTVYVGNLPPDALIDELLSLVKFGPIESVRILGEKSCAFISFLEGGTAAAFHADASLKKISLHGVELKIGWGKPSPVPAPVLLAIQQSNATRNVYLGGLDENVTEAQLRDDLSRFGLIDQIKIVRDKGIGFVHFLSIATATKVVNTLPTEPAWAGKRVNYGKDRCAFVPKTTPAAQAAVQVAASTLSQASPHGLFNPFSPYDSPNTPASAMAFMAAAAGGMSPGAGGLNRTVYLGNIHPETTTEDLCNAVRGGVLQSIRYMQDKHIAFITFIDPAAAFTFYQVASYQGLTLNNRRLKVGWGKNSGPLSPALALAVHSGATRNVYIGGIEDFELFNEERLKRDFGEYGDIELVNYLKEKNCAFVNFTNISNAIKAIDGIKNKSEYANLRIAHGKDRCANPPRSSNGSSGPRKPTGPSVSVTSPTIDGEEADETEVAALAAQAEEELLKEEESLRT